MPVTIFAFIFVLLNGVEKFDDSIEFWSFSVYFNPSPPIVKSAHVVEPVTAKPCCVVRVGQATHQGESS